MYDNFWEFKYVCKLIEESVETLQLVIGLKITNSAFTLFWNVLRREQGRNQALQQPWHDVGVQSWLPSPEPGGTTQKWRHAILNYFWSEYCCRTLPIRTIARTSRRLQNPDLRKRKVLILNSVLGDSVRGGLCGLNVKLVWKGPPSTSTNPCLFNYAKGNIHIYQLRFLSP